jgi:hypothetical protein
MFKRTITASLALAVALGVGFPCFAEPGEDETAGNNLSFPALMAEAPYSGIPASVMQGTAVLEGEYYLWNGVDPPCHPSDPGCDFSGEPPASISRLYVQKDSKNNWQAYSLANLSTIMASHVDVSDNLEAVSWRVNSAVRVEFVPFATTDLTGFEMVNVMGLGVDEVWGVRATHQQPSGVAFVETPGYGTVYSDTMLLSLTKLEPDIGTIDVLPDPVGIAYTWNPTTQLWEKAGGGAVAQTEKTAFTAEINVKGRLIFGHNWRLKSQTMAPGVEKGGWWRLTYFSSSAVSPIYYTAQTLLFDPIAGESEEAVPLTPEQVAEDDGGASANYPRTAVVDPTNSLVYIDVYIRSTTTGGGGGGGGGGGEENDTQLGAFSNGAWFLDRNGDYVFDPGTELVGWGEAGDTPLQADWNGDGSDEMAVFRNGVWYVDFNANQIYDGAVETVGWGESSWTPMPGDWDGDGSMNLGVVAPDSTWFVDLNGDFMFDPATEIRVWGSPGDTPVVGDWNGDGRDQIGVFSAGVWYLDRNSDGALDPATEMVGWGLAGWTPAPGDWNADGITDLGVVDPNSTWFRDLNGDFAFDPNTEITGWGVAGSTPVVEDWNQDGIDDVGVFIDGVWFADFNGDGVFQVLSEVKGWGFAGTTPTPGVWP